MCFSIFSCS